MPRRQRHVDIVRLGQALVAGRRPLSRFDTLDVLEIAHANRARANGLHGVTAHSANILHGPNDVSRQLRTRQGHNCDEDMVIQGVISASYTLLARPRGGSATGRNFRSPKVAILD